MSLYILDTDHLSLYEKGNIQVIHNLVLHVNDPIGISVITVLEQLGGWQRALNQAKDDAKRDQIYQRLGQTVESLSGWPVLPYTLGAMQRRAVFLGLRLNVGSNDLKIAAIALESNATVVTRNIRDFSRVPGLLWEDWSI